MNAFRGLSGGILFVLLVTIFFATTGGSRALPTDAAERAAILAVLTAQQSDWNNGNIRGFMGGYWNSPDLTFAGTRGFTRGWQPVMSRYEKTYSDKAAMGKLDFSELEIRPLGPDAALVLGRWHVQRQAGDIGGIFTLVFQKFPEGWRIIHDHTTQSPPEGQ
jgi:ketosteroid isomerase-like protein